MRWIAGLGLILALGACTTTRLKERQEAPAAQAVSLAGTWRLIAYEDRAEGQPLRKPYGDAPKGLLMLDAAGNMSIQIMRVPHPKVASGSDEKVTNEEKIALFDAYTAYWGTYRVDVARSVVVYKIEGDIADVFIGTEETRPFLFSGNRLVLAPEWTMDGVTWKGVRVFERVS